MSEYFRKYIKKEHYTTHPSNIRFKTNFKNCILEAFKKRTFKETDSENDWDVFWTEKEWIHDVMDHVHLQPQQRVNHFRNHYELTRKDLMIKNFKKTKKQLEKEGKAEEAALYSFYPTTYDLPKDYNLFVEEFKKAPGSVWIMKPIGKSQGKGIFLFNKLSQISTWKADFRWKPDNPQAEPYIVQKYIIDPLLIGGKKFDLRIYALVTNYSPLTVYLHRTGFARFTHQRYSSNIDDIANTYMHLTNVAVQKTAENYNERTGGKFDLRSLKLYLVSKFGMEKVNVCFNKIQDIITQSLKAVQKVIINDKHCFELYGYDILLDATLIPWILEINASPSMTANTPSDFEMKVELLDDTLTIVDMEKVLTGDEEQVGGFDLIYKGKPISVGKDLIIGTYLGCANNRIKQLKKLAKHTAARLATQYTQEHPASIPPTVPVHKETSIPVHKDTKQEKKPNEKDKTN